MNDSDILSGIHDQINNISAIVSKESPKTKIYDPFESDDTVSDSEVPYFVRIKKGTFCPDCNVEMVRNSDTTILCETCGHIDDKPESDVDFNDSPDPGGMINNYNCSDNSASPIRIAGPNNYAYQKKLIGNTSNYKKTQRKNTVDQIVNYVYQYKGPVPPKGIVLEAAELYYTVQQYYIKRGDVRKGCMAACLYLKCIENNITRKPKEISDIFGIPQSELSNGEKILDELQASGLITVKTSRLDPIQLEEQQINAFLSRYFESLNIPVEYKEFTYKLVRFTKKYRIAESSILSSKCSGAIYILSIKKKDLNIKRDTIEKECSISKSTFSRYSQAVMGVLNSTDDTKVKVRSRLRHLFKKYKIPL